MTSQIWWYATRAAGLMTWATAVASVLFGLSLSLVSARSTTPTGTLSTVLRRVTPSKPWTLDVHRFLGGLSVSFLIIHMVTLWADSFVTFGLNELLVPFASEWRPLPVAFGVVSAWLLAGIELSSLMKKWLPERIWHGVHLSSYLVAIFGTVHAITAGSDVGIPIIAFGGLLMLAMVVGLTIIRVAILRRGPNETDNDVRTEMLAKARAVREADPETLQSVESALARIDAPAFAEPKRVAPSPEVPVPTQQPVPAALRGQPLNGGAPLPVPAALQPRPRPAGRPAPAHRVPEIHDAAS